MSRAPPLHHSTKVPAHQGWKKGTAKFKCISSEYVRIKTSGWDEKSWKHNFTNVRADIYKRRQDLKLWMQQGEGVFLVKYIHPKESSFWQPVWGRHLNPNSNRKNWICLPSLVRLACPLQLTRKVASYRSRFIDPLEPQKSPNCRTLWSLESANWIIRGSLWRLSLVIVRLFILLTHAIRLPTDDVFPQKLARFAEH